MRLCETAGVALVAALLAGCGTVQNLTPVNGERASMEVYGGVQRALETWNPESPAHASSPVASSSKYAVNVAGSVIGDTLTLPVTLGVAIYDGIRDSSKQQPPNYVSPPFSNTDLPSHLTPERIHSGIL
jgi:uncharacterized protein YceK